MSEETEDVIRRIAESGQPIKLKTKIRRGTGTRDQDDIEVSVSGSDPATTAADLKETIQELEGLEDTLRSKQPTENEDE